jgi:hypothetical protein
MVSCMTDGWMHGWEGVCVNGCVVLSVKMTKHILFMYICTTIYFYAVYSPHS